MFSVHSNDDKINVHEVNRLLISFKMWVLVSVKSLVYGGCLSTAEMLINQLNDRLLKSQRHLTSLAHSGDKLLREFFEWMGFRRKHGNIEEEGSGFNPQMDQLLL